MEKHELLIKEENNLKENLQNKVTKTKEQLEYFFSEINNEIKIIEKLDKGIKKIDKEEKNIIKNLSYISKINKTYKNIKNVLQQLMKGIKFSYQKNDNSIRYEEYYFNGISIPINIEFKNISFSSLNISWENDNNNYINIDINNIKYKVEMRKENENFNQIYEGNKNNYFIVNLIQNTNYEFRICSFYNDFKSPWTQIKKMKTLSIDSNILKESEKIKLFLEKIYEWTGYKNMELIFRGTRDEGKNFHNKCDNKGPTITLIQNDKGYIFGGYASIPWTSSNTWKSAPDSFLFSFTNIYNIEPTKFPSKNDQKEIHHESNYGPEFGSGHDLGIYHNFIEKGGWSNFPVTYKDILGKGKSIFTSNYNNNSSNNFKINEYEIFKLLK